MIKEIKTLSIIIPVFNEEERLKKSLIQINRYIKNKKIEVIIVNDGSTDSTKEIIKQFIKINKKIKVINLKNNLGKGAALKKGILNAKNKFILTMDLDLSVPISQVFEWFQKKYINDRNNFKYFYEIYFKY